MSEITSGEALISLLLSCVCTELNTNGRPVCTCAVRHAIQWPSMDGCDCACDNNGSVGQAWARFQRFEPMETTYTADDRLCGLQVVATVDVGVHRCVSAFDGNSPRPPTPETLTSDALGLINDEYHIRKAVLCCPEPAGNGVLAGWRWRPTQSLPLGPMGDCAGVVLTVVATGTMRSTTA
jgi:hypothetical protein